MPAAAAVVVVTSNATFRATRAAAVRIRSDSSAFVFALVILTLIVIDVPTAAHITIEGIAISGAARYGRLQ